ncbi:hypothetical protein MTO96_000683 [Rhipicephalus appendiculatus]
MPAPRFRPEVDVTPSRPPAKPPRRSVACSPGVYEQLCLATTGGPQRRRRLSSGDSRSSADDASSRLCELSSLYDQAASECLQQQSGGRAPQHTRSASDNTGAPSDERPASLALHSSSAGSKRATVQIPLSPSHYDQPPTPEFPPPSPGTAESGIHSKMRPLSREYVVQQQRRRRLGSGSDGSGSRRSSRDVDTLTDEDELLLELNGGDAPSSTTTATLIVSSSSTSSSQQQPPPPASGIVEEIVEENPFAADLAAACRTAAAAVPSRFRGSVVSPSAAFRVVRRAHSFGAPRSLCCGCCVSISSSGEYLPGTANGRHGGAARVPVHLRRRRHGVPALGYGDRRRRRCVVTAPSSPPDLYYAHGARFSADRRPNGPHHRRKALPVVPAESSRFITGPRVSRTGRLTSPVISVGLRGH